MNFRQHIDAHVSVDRQLRLARAFAAAAVPFFADSLYAARIVLTNDLPGMAAIDRHLRVYFNPIIVEECMNGFSPEDVASQLAWVWVHEISHVLREHHIRGLAITAPAKIWNLVCDLEVNDCYFSRLSPPKKYQIVTCESFDFEPGHIAEFYYRELLQDHAIAEWIVANEGSGVHGETASWELSFDDPAAPGVSHAYQDALRAKAVKGMMSASYGTVPAGWIRWAECHTPRVDWRVVLNKMIKRAMSSTLARKSNYSFQRPSRRSTAYSPFIRPSLVGTQLSHIAVVVDTSGSMDSQLLNQAMSEVRAILDQLQSKVTAIPCDASAYEPIKILTGHDVAEASKNLLGGGGTDMVVGIEAAIALTPTPDVVIVLTDGYTPYPEKPPSKSNVVFAILNGGHCNCWNMPKWVQDTMISVPMEQDPC